VGWAGPVAPRQWGKKSYRILVGTSQEKRPFER